jgi:oxygen-independent coproporphyrinogen-3 oxidase
LARWQADIDGGRRATADRVALTNELLAADSVIFGLRMNGGVSLPRLQKRFPTPQWKGVEELWPRLLVEGLLTATPEGRISLTVRGRLVADAIGAEILAAFESAATVPVK